jgi:hypothetical protein
MVYGINFEAAVDPLETSSISTGEVVRTLCLPWLIASTASV